MFPKLFDFIYFHTPIFYLIQSVWRDEAFSYFMAKPGIFRIITNTAHDFNPPLYYILLHFWVLIFGKNVEFLRLLSFLPFIATVYLVYIFANKFFSKQFSFFVALFTFLNPMLLYYAFEIRMYSFYAFFTLCSLYFLYRKKWKWYTITSILGLYSHSFFPLIIGSYLLADFISENYKLNRKTAIRILNPLIFYIPWIPVLIVQFIQSKDSWMFPVDMQLIGSVLGNLFTGYEGTPGGWWIFTFLLSLVIIFFLYLGLKHYGKKAYPILIPLFVPLFSILFYSVLKRPIYVNRYLIFITVFEIVGISMGVHSIKKRLLRISAASGWIIFLIYFNIFISPFHNKTDFRSTFNEINKITTNKDYVYTKTPIGFLESEFYYNNPDKVFVFNPDHIKIPNYIGINIVFSDPSRDAFPLSPSRTFFVSDDAKYELIINR